MTDLLRLRNIITGLFILLISPQLTSHPSTNALSQTISVISLTFNVSTSSDWTKLTFYNLSLLMWRSNLISGERAPELTYYVTFDTINIGKRQYDETNVTIVVDVLVELGDRDVVLLIEKGAIGNTTFRILFEGKELVVMKSIGSVPGNEATNARFFNLSRNLAGLDAYAREMDLTKSLKQPMVLAFYYPWYGNPDGESRKLFHWENLNYYDIRSSTFYPLFGPYDSYDECLIEAHIKLAKEAGCDGFICSWWGTNSFEDVALRKILNVSNHENFNITIYYESVRRMGQDQIEKELAYVLNEYSAEPSFLKIDGKPVIFLYAVSAYGRDPIFWGNVVRKVEALSKVDALFIADTFDASYAESFDGFHTYNPIWIRVEMFNDMYVKESKVAKILGKMWASTVTPGYDDRKIRSPGTYIDREDGEYYNITWGASASSDPDFILICTWNEWHEGTNVEPSREFGFDYLRLTKSWTRICKGTTFEFPSEAKPILNQSIWASNGSISLMLKNEGDGDAFAVNILFNLNNSLRSTSNTIYLPVNDSCISLFIPLIRSNESHLIKISCDGVGDLIIYAFTSYYSLSGNAYVSVTTENLSLGEAINTSKGFQYEYLFAVLVLVLVLFLIQKFAKRVIS